MRLPLAALIFVAVSAGSLPAREPKVDEVAAPADAAPGKVALLTSGRGMKYFLRVPRGYDEREGARLIVFLHGSNMNGLRYLETIDDKRWCRDDILLCRNGEKGGDPFAANNFTFESAAYVAEVTENVGEAFEVTRCYIGGHSQGGFVTYSAIMRHPELFGGAFPMASDCWMQNEPNLWETEPEIMARQKRIAIAVIHGRADPIVSFSQGEHAHGVFLAMAYPKLRFFSPERLGHQFALGPVPEALEWLDAMTAVDPDESLRLAREWSRDGEWGWVHQAALAVLKAEDGGARSAAAARSAVAAVEREAVDAVVAMKESLASKTAREWLPEWFEFRRLFGATEAARELVADYEGARVREREEATALFRTAVGQRRAKESGAMRKTLKRILEETPHTYHAWYALRWLK